MRPGIIEPARPPRGVWRGALRCPIAGLGVLLVSCASGVSPLRPQGEEPAAAGPAGAPAAARDPARSASSAPPSDRSPLALDSFDGGGVYRGGSQLYLFIRGEASLAGRPMSVHLSQGQDGPWRPVLSGLTFRERCLWRLPEATGEGYRLRVEVEAGGGKAIEAVSRAPFAIDSTPPRVAIRAAESLGGGRVRVDLSAEDSPAGVERLRLWRAAQSGDAVSAATRWEEVDLAPPGPEDEPGSFAVLLPPGRHALHAAGVDRAGNAGPPPAGPEDAQALVEVPGAGPPEAPAGSGAADSRVPAAEPGAPRLTLLNFHDGAYRGGDRRYIFWKLEGVPSDEKLDLEFSADGGATWKEVARGIEARAGKYAWKLPLERGSARRLLLRLNVPLRSGLTARSAGEFIVDGRLPAARFLGPRFASAARTALRFDLLPPTQAADGAEPIPPQPVVSIECWARRRPDAPWTLAGRRSLDAEELRAPGAVSERDPAEAPGKVPEGTGSAESAGAGLPVFLEDGRHEVVLIPEDRIGNRPPLPPAGWQDPLGVLLVDTVRPSLAAALPGEKDRYAAGETLAIAIRAEDENLSELPVTIECEDRDAQAGWKVLERRFPPKGAYSFTVPEAAGPCRLRVTAADLSGNRSERILAFSVVPSAPRLRLLGFEAPRAVRAGETLSIRWESAPAATGAVTLRLSRDGGRTWSDLAKDLPRRGAFAWTTPAEDIAGLRLRLEAAGADGRSEAAESAPIAISARAPKVELVSVEPAVAPAPAAPPEKGE